MIPFLSLMFVSDGFVKMEGAGSTNRTGLARGGITPAGLLAPAIAASPSAARPLLSKTWRVAGFSIESIVGGLARVERARAALCWTNHAQLA